MHDIDVNLSNVNSNFDLKRNIQLHFETSNSNANFYSMVEDALPVLCLEMMSCHSVGLTPFPLGAHAEAWPLGTRADRTRTACPNVFVFYSTKKDPRAGLVLVLVDGWCQCCRTKRCFHFDHINGMNHSTQRCESVCQTNADLQKALSDCPVFNVLCGCTAQFLINL